jgi:hypothetical protein
MIEGSPELRGVHGEHHGLDESIRDPDTVFDSDSDIDDCCVHEPELAHRLDRDRVIEERPHKAHRRSTPFPSTAAFIIRLPIARSSTTNPTTTTAAAGSASTILSAPTPIPTTPTTTSASPTWTATTTSIQTD